MTFTYRESVYRQGAHGRGKRGVFPARRPRARSPWLWLPALVAAWCVGWLCAPRVSFDPAVRQAPVSTASSPQVLASDDEINWFRGHTVASVDTAPNGSCTVGTVAFATSTAQTYMCTGTFSQAATSSQTSQTFTWMPLSSGGSR